MPTDETPLAQRASSSFAQLTLAAKELNSISDELGKPISDIDIALKKLNLGVSVWVSIKKEEGGPNESWFWSEDIGYAKVGANWGICLRKLAGDYQDPDAEQEELWLFNDAPRALRISAIEKVPDLLEKLSNEAAKTTERIRARLSDAQAVAKAVNGGSGTARVRLSFTPPTQNEPLTGSTRLSDGLRAEAIRTAVISALTNAGHLSAAQYLEKGEWKEDVSGIRVVVPGVGKKLLSLIFNPATEKAIRQELQRLGLPPRFTVLSAIAATATKAESGSADESEVEK
jgi:hypothetical protein